MQGVTLLLVLCLAGLIGAGIVAAATLTRPLNERAGYYGRAARMRHAQADDDATTVAGIVALSDIGDLARMVADLDALAWRGVPLASVRQVPDLDQWVLDFRDGTSIVARVDDARAMRRAGSLASRDALVVARVQPLGTAALVDLCTPRHGPVKVALRA